MWVLVVGARGMDLGVEADDDISRRRLGLFVAWEVRAAAKAAEVASADVGGPPDHLIL